MRHEPRPTIHMEKHLGWAHKLGGVESLGISKCRSNRVSQFDGVSDMAPAYWLCGGRFSEVTMAYACLMSNTSAFLCIPLVPFKLLSWGWSSEGVSLRKCLGLQQFLPPTLSPPVFAARSCGDLPSWPCNPGLGAWYVAGTPRSRDIPPNFYPQHVGEGPAGLAFAPLLLVWMDMVPLIP